MSSAPASAPPLVHLGTVRTPCNIWSAYRPLRKLRAHTGAAHSGMAYAVRLLNLRDSFTQRLGRTGSAYNATGGNAKHWLGIAGGNNGRGFNHQNDGAVPCACAMDHALWSDEVLARLKIDRPTLEIDDEGPVEDNKPRRPQRGSACTG